MVLILAPPSRFLVPRNHLSFMPPRRTQRSANPSVRRCKLARELLEPAMRPYNNCSRLNKQYLIGPESDRYSSCISSRKKCDLVVSLLEIRRIKNERKGLLAQLAEIIAKISRLYSQLEFVEKRKREIVDRELSNIEELEKDERRAVSDPNDFLFNVSSE